ncbi:MAG: B12-binding domain-containing radical SAM protein [Bacteroidales bacterium]|nr:B12-binding domain-containing radical SAM protein [Bacteroidales bacterium]
MSKNKLILINPFNQHTKQGTYDTHTISPPLGLGIIAALTPKDWEVEIIDENFEEFAFADADLVGITAVTANVNRAYEIASLYKKSNIPIIIGGIHASMVPDEAEKYVEVVVIGEAESIWKILISDFENGRLKKRYDGELLPMKNMPLPRRDLFHPNYSYANIQTTRGCPMKCDFCSVHTFNGSQYRQRPVEEVLDELETIPQDLVYFVDDNIIGYSKQSAERAISLFKGMIERGIKKDWYCQASLNVADNEDVLKYAAESGCRLILIGIESEKEEQLQEANKKLNLKMGIENYQEVFDRIHKYGISVLGALIYGLDSDSIEDLYDRTRFAIDSGMDAMQATIVTPLPGTGLYKRMQKENRLTYTNYPEDWKYYHFLEAVHKPLKMNPDEFMEAMLENWSIMYDDKLLKKKMLRSLKATRSPKAATWAYLSNVERHNICFGDRKPPLDPNVLLGGVENRE